jgi:hypothetical protein
VLFLFALGLALLAAHPALTLLALAYGYLGFSLVELVWHRLRRRPGHEEHAGDTGTATAKDTKAL